MRPYAGQFSARFSPLIKDPCNSRELPAEQVYESEQALEESSKAECFDTLLQLFRPYTAWLTACAIP